MNSTSGFRPLILNFSLLFALIITLSFSLSAQEPEDADSLRDKASKLIDQDKYIEALPVLEKLILADPKDADASFYYGFSLLAKAQGLKGTEDGKKLRIRARKAFIKAKELGAQQNILDALIDSVPPDGTYPSKFSKNAQAETLMTQGESAFTQGKYDEALKLYGDALKLDPTIYEAALFSGDMYLRKGEFDDAEIWYQKAIKIDPNRETAYRYSATPLMQQKKYDQARDRYIEAFIVEPYSRFATSGILRWSQETDTPVGHPKFDIPEYTVDEKGKAQSKITIGSLDNDGSIAWISYTTTRNEWRDKTFAKTFPKEKEYRHTLKEEAEALRSVVKLAKELKSKKTALNDQFKTLIELDEKGLLEAYILMAIPDEGIALDHADYLKTHRDKLRQYVNEYVIIKDEK